MMPATSRGLMGLGRLFALGVVCLFLHRVSIFLVLIFYSNILQQPTDSWNWYIFTNKIWHPREELLVHWGIYSPVGKSTLKNEVRSSWCPALLPLKSMGALPATSVGEGVDTYFAWQKFLYNFTKGGKKCARLHDTVLLGEQNWPPTPLSCLSLGRDAPHFKCAIVQSYTNLVLIPLVLIQLAYITNANW